jgi:hypothetical protein
MPVPGHYGNVFDMGITRNLHLLFAWCPSTKLKPRHLLWMVPRKCIVLLMMFSEQVTCVMSLIILLFRTIARNKYSYNVRLLAQVTWPTQGTHMYLTISHMQQHVHVVIFVVNNCWHDTESDDEREEEILQRTGNYLASKSEMLPKGILNIKRVKDANSAKPSNVRLHFDYI